MEYEFGKLYVFEDGYGVMVIDSSESKDETGISWTSLRMDIATNDIIKNILINKMRVVPSLLEGGEYTLKYHTSAIQPTKVNSHVKAFVRENFDGTIPTGSSSFIDIINNMQAEIKRLRGQLAIQRGQLAKYSYEGEPAKRKELEEMRQKVEIFTPKYLPAKSSVKQE